MGGHHREVGRRGVVDELETVVGPPDVRPAEGTKQTLGDAKLLQPVQGGVAGEKRPRGVESLVLVLYYRRAADDKMLRGRDER